MSKEFNDYDELKEEGRAGLLFALDAQENCVSAEEAVSGGKYFCPVCACKMHVVTSPKGKRYFARNAGAQHTNGKCISYETLKTKHTFDDLDPEKFICSLCRVASRKDRDDGKGAHDSNGGDTRIPDDDETRISPFTTLKQIANEMNYLDANKVTDFLLTYRNAQQVIQGKNFNLGARIVHCRFAAYKGESNALLFDLFCKSYDATVLSVRFSLVFTNKKEFLNYREKFGTPREMENGGARFVKHHDVQDVLLACDNWELITSPQCKSNCGRNECGKCYGMYQALFTNKKQLHLIPADD